MPIATKAGKTAAFCGEIRVLRRLSPYEFGVELRVMREGKNRNDWDYRNLAEHYLSFVGQPILVAYVDPNHPGDGHNMREKFDPKTGELYYSFTDGTAERIVGTLSDDPKDFTLVERDGHTWLDAKGRLFAFYAKELVDYIVKQGTMEVSAETEVEEDPAEPNIFYNWVGLGVTILGKDVQPAIPGARITAMAALKKEFNQVKLRAASYRANEAKKQARKIKHQGVKKSMNRQALARLAPKFEGYRIVGLSEDGNHVALMDDKGGAYEYTFLAEDNGAVVPTRIREISLCAFIGEGDEAVTVDADAIYEIGFNAASQESGDVHDLTERLNAANETITRLQQAEHERRVNEVKDTLKRTLAEIRVASHEGDEDLSGEMDRLAANAEQYAAMEDEGRFVGAERARRDLMAVKGEKDTVRANELAARRKNSFAWSNGAGGSEGDDGIAGMLSRING
nr:MAG TPA: hypothetical protein [Caudoviricetes sp.]